MLLVSVAVAGSSHWRIFLPFVRPTQRNPGHRSGVALWRGRVFFFVRIAVCATGARRRVAPRDWFRMIIFISDTFVFAR